MADPFAQQKQTLLINYSLEIFIILICLARSGHVSPIVLPLCFLFWFFFFFFLVRLLFTYLSILVLAAPPCLTPYGCGSNNVKHFALASFCNLQFPNVRPVESWSDNGHALPPVVFVPPYLPSINATAGVSCNNTCTSELPA